MDQPRYLALSSAALSRVPPEHFEFDRPDPTRLPSGILQGGLHVLFLGELWRKDDPDSWPNDLKTAALGRPNHYALQMYAKFLKEAYEQGRPHLQVEMEQWKEYRQRLLTDLIEPHINHYGPSDHWLWTRKCLDRHPTMNWAGSHDMLVVRLTWALVRTDPQDVLPPNKWPRQGTPECPDNAEYRRCVNPRHYYVAWTRRDQRIMGYRARDSADTYLRGQARMRKQNPTDWELEAQFTEMAARDGSLRPGVIDISELGAPKPVPEPPAFVPPFRLPGIDDDLDERI